MWAPGGSRPWGRESSTRACAPSARQIWLAPYLTICTMRSPVVGHSCPTRRPGHFARAEPPHPHVLALLVHAASLGCPNCCAAATLNTWRVGTTLQRAPASPEIARRPRDWIYARRPTCLPERDTRKGEPTGRRPTMGNETQRLSRSRRTGALVPSPPISGFRTTGLRGIGASGLPLIPLEKCETPRCKRKPLVRAVDRDTRLAYCPVCWPTGNA